MRAILLLALLASCAPEHQIYECVAVHACDGPKISVPFEVCGSDRDMRRAIDEWVGTCDDVAGFYGCGQWLCGATCWPTGRSCVP